MTRPLVAVWRDTLLSPNGLTATEKAVGLAVAKHADHNGSSCYPSQATIAAEAGCGLRTVQRALGALEAAGWLIVEKVPISGGPQGRAWRSSYHLTLPEEHAIVTGSPREEHATMAASFEKSTPSTTEEHVTVAQEPVQEPEETPTQEREPARMTASSERRRSGNDYWPEFEAVWKLYPKRLGGNPKRGAFRAWRARVRSGVDPAELEAGVRRYLHFCEETGKIGSQYVKTASAFFGRDEHWREDWSVDPPDEEVRLDPNIFDRVRRA